MAHSSFILPSPRCPRCSAPAWLISWGVQPATHGATIMRVHVTGLFTTKNHEHKFIVGYWQSNILVSSHDDEEQLVVRCNEHWKNLDVCIDDHHDHPKIWVTQSNSWPVPKIPLVSTLPTVFPRLDHGLQRAADQVVRRLLQRLRSVWLVSTPPTR